MNHIMRYLGLVLILLGVIVLGVYYMGAFTSNGALLFAAILMVAGLIGHIVVNKLFQED